MTMPKLGEVQVGRMQFGPTDRAVVRCFRRLSTDDERKIRKAVARWAGIDEDRVIVIAVTDMEISKG